MRLRFWLGFAVVAAIAVGSIAVALVVHDRESDSFETRQHGEALRAAHQAGELAALSVGQLSSASAFYQAEGHFNRHEFKVVADSLLRPGGLTATAFIGSLPAARRAGFERARQPSLFQQRAARVGAPAAHLRGRGHEGPRDPRR